MRPGAILITHFILIIASNFEKRLEMYKSSELICSNNSSLVQREYKLTIQIFPQKYFLILCYIKVILGTKYILKMTLSNLKTNLVCKPNIFSKIFLMKHHNNETSEHQCQIINEFVENSNDYNNRVGCLKNVFLLS